MLLVGKSRVLHVIGYVEVKYICIPLSLIFLFHCTAIFRLYIGIDLIDYVLI